MAPRYKADGQFNLPGLVLAALLGSIAGVAVGYVLGYIGAEWFSLILLWPAAMGGAAGMAVMFIVKKTHIRNAKLAALLGILCATLSYVASHHVHYLMAQSEFVSEMADEGLEVSGEEMDVFLEMQTGSRGFLGFLKMKAQRVRNESAQAATTGSGHG